MELDNKLTWADALAPDYFDGTFHGTYTNVGRPRVAAVDVCRATRSILSSTGRLYMSMALIGVIMGYTLVHIVSNPD